MRSDPNILAFDTSAAHCAVALLSGDRLLTQTTVDMARGQAEALMPLIEAQLAAARLTLADLHLIAVGIGPGNFTGTRISVAAARGLSLGAGLPAMGVSRFELLRGPKGPHIRALHAPRDTVYVQAFDGDAATAPPSHLPTLPAPAIGPTTGPATGPADIPDVAQSIARVALRRWLLGETRPARPAPLYVRPADAAPPRDAPPVILHDA